MAEPELVAECVQAMQQVCDIPVTVKSRIGIDEQDSYEFLHRFVSIVSAGGCQQFIIHARKAWLSGLSPKQNREIPPLDYPRVYRLKQDFPQLDIAINGGIKSLNEASEHLQHLDGAMIGREIYQNPYLLAQADQQIWQSDAPVLSREQVIEGMFDYIDRYVASGGRAWHVVRHMLGLCNGLHGAKIYRRYLSENAGADGAGSEVLKAAFAHVGVPVVSNIS
jgi:tRNA-dihydrouridine synthase A